VAFNANGFDLGRVDAAVAGTVFAGKLHHFASTDSTQTRALEAAHAGVDSGQVYIADAQTAGRGRGGHAWHSEPDRGLYLTVLMRPRMMAEAALRISLAAGLAARDAIAETNGTDIDLRWPNDLVSRGDGSGGESRGGLKLGGILTETAMEPGGALRHAAIGIGVNLHQAAFPKELEATATSLLLVSGRRTEREALAGSLLRRLDAELRSLEGTGSRVLERFAEASSWVAGKRVHVAEDSVAAEGGYTGVTRGLTPDGLLRVLCDDGSERIVRHGGVRGAEI